MEEEVFPILAEVASLLAVNLPLIHAAADEKAVMTIHDHVQLSLTRQLDQLRLLSIGATNLGHTRLGKACAATQDLLSAAYRTLRLHTTDAKTDLALRQKEVVS